MPLVLTPPQWGQPQNVPSIDTTSPLARGLLGYCIATPNGLVNLADPRNYSTMPGTIPTSYLVGAQGVGRHQTPTASATQFEQINGLQLPALTSASKFTVFCVATQVSWGGATVGVANARMYSTLEWTVGGGVSISTGAALNDINATILNISGARQTGNVNVQPNTTFTAFLSHTGTVLNLEVNGIAATPASSSALSAAASTAGLMRFGVNIITTTPGERVLYVTGAWSRELNVEEKQILYTNPYALAARQRRYLPIGGAAPVDPVLSNLVATSITSTGAIPRVDYAA